MTATISPLRKAQEATEPDSGPPVDERPRSTYEIVTRQMLQSLKEDVAEIKGRVNALLWLIAGALVLDVLTKLAG